MHWDVTGIIIDPVRADHMVAGGHLAGEARSLVGDVVRFPALLFYSSREMASDCGQVGEALCLTSFSLPIRDVELDLDQILCFLTVRRNLHHDVRLKEPQRKTIKIHKELQLFSS